MPDDLGRLRTTHGGGGFFLGRGLWVLARVVPEVEGFDGLDARTKPPAERAVVHSALLLVASQLYKDLKLAEVYALGLARLDAYNFGVLEVLSHIHGRDEPVLVSI